MQQMKSDLVYSVFLLCSGANPSGPHVKMFTMKSDTYHRLEHKWRKGQRSGEIASKLCCQVLVSLKKGGGWGNAGTRLLTL